jgi:hypothetical protein
VHSHDAVIGEVLAVAVVEANSVEDTVTEVFAEKEAIDGAVMKAVLRSKVLKDSQADH